jgi:DNA polymerase-3 subunit delta'
MFEGLIGNEQLKERLVRLFGSERIPQALLFAGREGIGKKQFAMRLAAAFVCESGSGCGKCRSCKRALETDVPKADDKDAFLRVVFSGHPDVGSVLPYKRNVLIDAIRDLDKEAHFRPFEAAKRIFIIDDAHKMNANASNALLKTLEEPPETSWIFLVTSQPERLLSTITSRCQTIRFASVAAQEIEEFLNIRGVFGGEKAALVSRICGGNIGNAIALDLDTFLEMRSTMLDVLDAALLKGSRAKMLQIGEMMNDAAHKDSYEAAMDVLEMLIRDMWLLANGVGRENLTNFDIADRLSLLSERVASHRLAEWLSEIELLTQRLSVNINRKVATDALFMNMAA